MHEALRELTAEGYYVSLAPQPMRDGIEYVLSVSIENFEREASKGKHFALLGNMAGFRDHHSGNGRVLVVFEIDVE